MRPDSSKQSSDMEANVPKTLITLRFFKNIEEYKSEDPVMK